MRFAIKGETFTFETPFLCHWHADGRLRACGDLSLYLYSRPNCADAVRIATAMLDNPNFTGR